MSSKLLSLERYLLESGFEKEALNLSSILEQITGVENSLSESLTAIRSGAATLAIGAEDDPASNSVKEIQGMLEGHGYTLRRHGVDGIFGPETEGMVRSFQENNGLPSTGVINSQTLSKLESSSAVAAAAGASMYDRFIGLFDSTESPSDRAVSSNSGRVSEQQLYSDLISRLGNRNLCIAMVANAIAESGLRPGIAGDCGSYANRHPEKSVNIEGKGPCCSFGLWLYNICGGMGIGFLEANGNPSSSEDKMRVLSDYNLQVDYMIGKLQSRYSSEISQERSIDEWVDWFVRTIERPANPDRSVVRRQGIARGLNGLA